MNNNNIQYTVVKDAERELDPDTFGATNRTAMIIGCWIVWDNDKDEYTGYLFQLKREAQAWADEMNGGN
jgi:hypothetical protein